MNRYVKEYITRGLIFAGFGPIVLGIIYSFLQAFDANFKLDGYSALLGIISTYIIAFVHAGSSIFVSIESFSKIKALFCQLISLYLVYTLAYLINSWIPFDLKILLIYTAIFIVVFLLIWLIVYISVEITSKKMTEKLISKENNK